ncbi:Oxaloacetate decarboxylase, gamma chain [Cohaesibacter sp. ES.047]|uniref:OadG family protein n=1 Tax=Cohaesibacter sp. ES.047 TaxID=1798205 RepID=UPI000BB6E891|nr:OadG family protein [Cohaesibacter sp. ES.047]SNY90015.1 Oxaloacetate decarboxylase, gamma chain [Cohaesibacter sp. ES.047]
MLENLELIVIGFAVVLLALASLWASCSIVGFFFTRTPKKAKEEQSPQVPARAAVASRAGVPPHHLAAIAAAVVDTLGPGYRVTRVAAPAHKVSEWPMEGRIAAFTAHKTRADWGPMAPTLARETQKS